MLSACSNGCEHALGFRHHRRRDDLGCGRFSPQADRSAFAPVAGHTTTFAPVPRWPPERRRTRRRQSDARTAHRAWPGCSRRSNTAAGHPICRASPRRWRKSAATRQHTCCIANSFAAFQTTRSSKAGIGSTSRKVCAGCKMPRACRICSRCPAHGDNAPLGHFFAAEAACCPGFIDALRRPHERSAGLPFACCI